MLKIIIWLLVLVFIIGPILWLIADADIRRQNKKIEDYYKQREAEKKADLYVPDDD